MREERISDGRTVKGSEKGEGGREKGRKGREGREGKRGMGVDPTKCGRCDQV